eukprot:TRINITY_DN13592_c0_g1_i1.p1 TRINITY_DN13592_c0_g1~~TRINITY_DN13592_c0_g1_i1.p1  ORF type:complete len:370 (+),score=49.12 TRINITY_DN13592_c0_g1_i1:128-1111(+)
MCAMASRHGIRTHNALKALHLEDLFGPKGKKCVVPGAEIKEIPSKFAATKRWDAQKKLGQSVALRALEKAMEMADEFGIGQVVVDNAFHYLWGGGYVMEAAKKGYIAYTNCTSTVAEVVPFMGKSPTLGTNPHSWGFPTTKTLGYPIVVDWATSTVAMGRVQQLKREGKQLPANTAVDKDGNITTDPDNVAALLPFGAHKGYGMCLIDELYAALIGGSLPTFRGRDTPEGEKNTATFYFQVVHPEAFNCGDYAKGRTQEQNVQAVIDDVLAHGNESCMLPGQIEADAAKKTDAAGGLLFSEAEVAAFNELAKGCGAEPWDLAGLKKA